MAISGSQITISNFLSQQKQYSIPRYQRGYVWEEKQWSQLFDDLKTNCIKNKAEGHFIGSVVIYDQAGVNYTTAHIIDGQQRLTTFSILILTIMRYADMTNNKDLFDGMRPYVKAKSPAGIAYDKFYNEHNPYYKDLLNACCTWHDDKTLIKDNCDLTKKKYAFEEKFIMNCFFKMFGYLINAIDSKEIILSQFVNKAMSTLIIETISTDVKESYTVFEILNARGKPLESFELIKNYIMRNYETEGTPDTALVKWNELSDILTNNNVLQKDFFEHYVSHKYKKEFDKKSKKEKLTTYDYITRNNEEDKAKILLDDLTLKSQYYILFNVPTKMDMTQGKDSYTIFNSLSFFRGRAKKQFRPLFLSLFDKFYCPNEEDTNIKSESYSKLAKAMAFLENFYFVYGVVTKSPTRSLERVVHETAYAISSCETSNLDEVVANMYATFSSMLPEYETFQNAFCNLGYSRKNERFGEEEGNKSDVQYILKKYEQLLRNTNDEIDVFTIEHIRKDSLKDYTAKIGNLICLEEEYNNNLGSKKISTKIPYYKKSVFLSAQEASGFATDDWSKNEIEERSKTLSYKLYGKLWSELVTNEESDVVALEVVEEEKELVCV